MQKFMTVLPNPWGVNPREVLCKDLKRKAGTLPTQAVVDGRGRPSCSVLVDVNQHVRLHAYVGAKLDKTRSTFKGEVDELRAKVSKTAWSFLGLTPDDPAFIAKLAKSEPVRVPVTPYYQRVLREGGLIPVCKLAQSFVSYKYEEKDLVALMTALDEMAGKIFDNSRAEGAETYGELKKARQDAFVAAEKAKVAPAKAEPQPEVAEKQTTSNKGERSTK